MTQRSKLLWEPKAYAIYSTLTHIFMYGQSGQHNPTLAQSIQGSCLESTAHHEPHCSGELASGRSLPQRDGPASQQSRRPSPRSSPYLHHPFVSPKQPPLEPAQVPLAPSMPVMAAPPPQFTCTPDMMTAFATFLSAYGRDGVPSGASHSLPIPRPQVDAQPPKQIFFSHAITSAISDLPISVIKELRNGFKNYIPLALCTHKACSNMTCSTDSVDTEIAWMDKGEMRLKQKAMMAGKDHYITTDDFTKI